LKAVRIYSEDLVATEMQKTKVKVNKQTYAGFCVLQLSKWVMYRPRRDCCLPHCGHVAGRLPQAVCQAGHREGSRVEQVDEDDSAG
jgi:hypothetical protein